MSKSVRRVRQALAAAGIETEIHEMPETTRTAIAAAEAVGCTVDQIAKSVIFRCTGRVQTVLFVTAGGNRVDPPKAAALAGEALAPADAAFVRAETGFVIGGVAPLGHLKPPIVYFDPKLLEFDTVWAAAGTPRHVFPVGSRTLLSATEGRTGTFTEDPM